MRKEEEEAPSTCVLAYRAHNMYIRVKATYEVLVQRTHVACSVIVVRAPAKAQAFSIRRELYGTYTGKCREPQVSFSTHSLVALVNPGSECNLALCANASSYALSVSEPENVFNEFTFPTVSFPWWRSPVLCTRFIPS